LKNKLTITYQNNDVKTAKKEVGSALSSLFLIRVTSAAAAKQNRIKTKVDLVFSLKLSSSFLPIVLFYFSFGTIEAGEGSAVCRRFPSVSLRLGSLTPNDKTIGDFQRCRRM